jgi:hypothetical protein
MWRCLGLIALVGCSRPANLSLDGAIPTGDASIDATGVDAATDTGLPRSFFSMTWATRAAPPTVPVGGLRLWDTTAVWPKLNPQSGTYAFGELDAWLDAAEAAHVDVIFTFGRTPQWASLRMDEPCTYGSGCAAPPSDVDADDAILKSFATALVDHAVGRIKYYEIWNEPDLPGTWSGTYPQLVAMGKDITAIVHARDPAALVIGPSPSTGNQFGIHFLPMYYAAGGAPYQDIVGMHGYLYDNGVFATVPENIVDTITQLRTLMAANNVAAPIFFTEGSWGGAPNNAAMTADAKVAYLARDYLLMWMHGIDRFYWYGWDTSTFGTLFTGGTIQPDGVAYGILESWLIGSTHAANNCTQDPDATWTCSLVRADHTPALILWNATATHSATVPTAFVSYLTLDNTAATAIANHVVNVGAKPIMVTP